MDEVLRKKLTALLFTVYRQGYFTETEMLELLEKIPLKVEEL